jgi:FdhE protein
LLGQGRGLPRDIAEALGELDRLAGERPALAGPAALLRDLLPALCAGAVAETPPPLGRESAAAKLAGGVPLLRGESVGLDLPAFRRRWLAACAAVERHQSPGAGRALAGAMRAGRIAPAELAAEVLAGRPEGVHARAGALGLDPGLTASVLGLVLFPVLSSLAAALAPLREGAAWEHGHCPTCGSWPLLGEFRGLGQARFLRCGLCASGWEVPRLFCPYCGNRDHEALGYVAVEGEEARQRAAVCERCRGYVKMVSALAALPGPRLLAANVATLHLDLAAGQRGYAAPP